MLKGVPVTQGPEEFYLMVLLTNASIPVFILGKRL